VDAAGLAPAIDACNAERSHPAEPGEPGPSCLLAGTPPPDHRLHEVAERAGFTAVGPTLVETWTQLGAIVELADGDAMAALARQVHADPAGPRSFADAGAALLESIAESGAEAVVLWQIEEDEAQAWHLPSQRAALASEGLPALVMTRRDWLARDGAAGLNRGISARHRQMSCSRAIASHCWAPWRTGRWQGSLHRWARTWGGPVEGASFVIDDLGLEATKDLRIPETAVHVSVTPFGSGGPRSHWRGGELVASATGGALRVTGEPGRPPVKEAGDACTFHADMVAAAGAMAAHYARGTHGHGQHVDVSIQQVAFSRNTNGVLVWQFDKRKLHRVGGKLAYGQATIRAIWRLATAGASIR
jgi:hypothetical protein